MNEFLNCIPELSAKVFIAPNATVIGAVSVGENSSIWYGAVLRGDSDTIRIGKCTNIQDNAVIHCDPAYPASIGDNCTIGHCAIVHGATVENNVLIGMNATVLNGAIIGKNSIVGAASLVTTNAVIPPNSLVMGVPAKVIKELNETQIADIQKNADVYVQKAFEHKELIAKQP